MLLRHGTMDLWLLLAVLICTAVSLVDGGGYLWMKLIDYVNPRGKGSNGHYCDGKFFIRGSPCDHKFIICVDRANGPNTVGSCTYGRRDTGEISNQNSITFGSLVGHIRNPTTFRFNSWPGVVKIKVEIWDVDGNDNDYVDFLRMIYTTIPSGRSAVRYKLRSRTRMNVELKVYCESDYYGRDCSSYCRPRNDSFGHFTCNQRTGGKVCMKGWKGVDCNVLEDACSSSPCQNGGVCHSDAKGYSCVCVDGYEGDNCETEINECESSPCGSNGICWDSVNGFTCTCSSGWSGVTCDENIDECLSEPCSNNGTCLDGISGYRCLCQSGWTGTSCDTNINECNNNPCLNNATCVDRHGHFECKCQSGFEGILCDEEIDDCHSNPCENDGNCTALIDGFVCQCIEPWTGPTCNSHVQATDSNTTRVCSNLNGSSEIEVSQVNWSIKEKQKFVFLLRTLLCKYGKMIMDAVSVKADFSFKQRKNNRAPVVYFMVYENQTKKCPEDVDLLVRKFDVQDISNLKQITVAYLNEDAGGPVTSQAQKSWIESNLYIVIGIALVCLIATSLIVVYFVIRKRKQKLFVINQRKITNDTAEISEMNDEFSPISFENVLYAQTIPGENSRLNLDYNFED